MRDSRPHTRARAHYKHLASIFRRKRGKEINRERREYGQLEKSALAGDVGKDAEFSCSWGDRSATRRTGAMEKWELGDESRTSLANSRHGTPLTDRLVPRIFHSPPARLVTWQKLVIKIRVKPCNHNNKQNPIGSEFLKHQEDIFYNWTIACFPAHRHSADMLILSIQVTNAGQ